MSAVFFVEEGPEDAMPLLLGNSLGATVSMWDAQAPALAERFRLIRYDHRGHGRSPIPDGPYSIDDFADDVVELLDKLGIEKAHYCGLSIGGMTGINLAARHLERIDRLIVCCSSAHMPPASKWQERAAMVREAGSVAAVADAVAERWLTPAYATEHPEVLGRLHEMLAGSPPDGYIAACGAIERMDLRPLLGGVETPTLVIAGEYDLAAPPAQHGQLIAEGIPEARYALVPAAHLANVEQDKRVTDLILEHLEAT